MQGNVRSPSTPAGSVIEIWKWPDGSPPRFFRLLTPHSGEEDAPILGYFTHWVKNGKSGRSVICRGVKVCDQTLHKVRPIWYGYVAAEIWEEKRKLWFPTVLQVTENLEQDMRQQYDRGQTWKISKLNVKGKGSPVTGILWKVQDAETFPPPFDYMRAVRHLFHEPTLEMGTERNPLPPRLIVEPSIADAPDSPEEQLARLEIANEKAREQRLKDAPTPGPRPSLVDAFKGNGKH